MNMEARQNGEIPANGKSHTAKALTKWFTLGLLGIGCLIFAVACYFRQDYTWVLAAAFLGCFLTSASWKKIRLLITAGRALKAGKGSIVIFYRDKNLKETQNPVIPVGADTVYFYGFSPEKKDIKVFRWERILRALDQEKEIGKDAILQSVAGASAKTKDPAE
jgi:hypothetical protein